MATIDPTKTTIPAEMLQVQNRIETPSLNLSDPTPDLQGVFSTLPQEQRQLEVDQAGQRTGASNFSSLVQSLTGMGADQAALEEKAGIGAIQKDVTDLTNQLNLLKAESQTIPLQTQQDYQGRLSTQAGVSAIETGKLRENAIKALTTSALLQAKQGSLLTAQNQVDRAIQLKSEPIKAQIEAIRQQLEINDKYFITPAEKKLAEKQKIALAERERQIKKQEEGEQQLLTLITNASSQGAPQELLRRAQAAKTPMEASVILGQYAGDYWGTKYKIAQYNKMLADTQKAQTEAKIAANGATTTTGNSPETQAKFLIDTIAQAQALSGASGRSLGRRKIEEFTVGSTDYTNLEAKVRTLKNNLLTMATDPNIKKFFGPQMTDSDVKNMLAAATTLDTEAQSPEELNAELNRVTSLFQRFAPGYAPPKMDYKTGNPGFDFWFMTTSSSLQQSNRDGGYVDNQQ